MDLFVLNKRLRLLREIESVDRVASVPDCVQISSKARQHRVNTRAADAGRTTHWTVVDQDRFHASTFHSSES